MDRFPALRLILRFGGTAAIILAVLIGAGITGLLWSMLGWPALFIGLAAAALSYILVKSYVEIVSIVTEMVH
ncbi:MAG: hypothetical protein M0P39_03235 [Rhodocyclaceae bacterium]|jgi:membrane protein implicated in regulation of membrane protease activity|nr:hypothetical protein [Rhodocyclaceae bacterium]